MKRILSFFIALMAGATLAATETIVRTIPEAAAELIESDMWRGNTVVTVRDDAYLYPTEPEGHPLLPYTIVEIPLPSGSVVTDVTTDVGTWEKLGANVPVLPIQALVPTTENPEVPDFIPLNPEIATGGPYPAQVGEYTGVTTQDGRPVVTVKLTPFRWTPWGRVVEQAKDVSIRVTYEKSATSRLRLAAAPLGVDEKPIFLILAPEDLYTTWKWYGEQRQAAHPEVTVAVVNTKTIYDAYPFKNVRVPKDRLFDAAFVLSGEADLKRFLRRAKCGLQELSNAVETVLNTAYETYVAPKPENGKQTNELTPSGLGWALELSEWLCAEYGWSWQTALETPVATAYALIAAARARHGGKHGAPDYIERQFLADVKAGKAKLIDIK